MIRHIHSSSALKWSLLIVFCWLTVQLVGYHHRISHSFAQQTHIGEHCQHQSSIQQQPQSAVEYAPEIEHHCSAWDHGVLGFGLALGILAFEILFARFIFKPTLCFKGQFSHFFSSYHSRAPPTTF